MSRQSERKIILVTRKTRIDDLIARFNTESQAKFYIEHLGDDYSDYQREHANYYESVRFCVKALSKYGRLQHIDRSFLPNFIFGGNDLVVVLGQDGLVANTLKYLDGHAVLGLNPDPSRWDGVLLPFTADDLETVIGEAISDDLPFREITMAEVRLNTGEVMHAVNDFFIGPKSHTSARYVISSGKEEELQSSSGVIVSTGLGSTGWFKSLVAGATGMTEKLVGTDLPNSFGQQFTWESDHLYFTVREPFPSASSEANLVFGRIDRGRPLTMISRMADHGVIFSDGIEKDFLEFNSGTEAVVSIADKKGRILQ